jgi:hypothetical protein
LFHLYKKEFTALGTVLIGPAGLARSHTNIHLILLESFQAIMDLMFLVLARTPRISNNTSSMSVSLFSFLFKFRKVLQYISCPYKHILDRLSFCQELDFFLVPCLVNERPSGFAYSMYVSFLNACSELESLSSTWLFFFFFFLHFTIISPFAESIFKQFAV